MMVFALAAVANEAQDKIYSYDYYPYWTQDNHREQDNSAVKRFSPVPSVKRQFLQLFGEGVPAALLSSAAGVSNKRTASKFVSFGRCF